MEEESLPEIRLVYLAGCQELHATRDTLPEEVQQDIKKRAQSVIARSRDAFQRLQIAQKGATSKEDAKFEVPPSLNTPITIEMMTNILLQMIMFYKY